MINDEKRREVADKMRGYDVSEFKESAIVPFLECLGHGYTNWRGVLDELADLIDRPTCRNVSGHQDVFTCSECRCKVEIIGEECNEYGECFCVPFMPSFCPSCGAEVVDE